MNEKQRQQFQQMYHALYLISKKYMTPEQMQRKSNRMYGLEYSEALEYAYENMQTTARNAIRGVRLPKVPPASSAEGSDKT
jgi:hypothetical protein